VSRRVYVAERGLYEERYEAGIFDSPERAMAAMPGNRWRKTTWTNYPNWPDLSVVTHRVSWDNDLDWDQSVRIIEVDWPPAVTEVGPLREADEKVVQTLREDGGWDYVPEQPR
jgi:hypothetical protein